MSVDVSRTGESQAYRIEAVAATLVPFCTWPQLPQPLPVPGFELRGVSGSLTRWSFSHGAVPVVVIVAEAPNSGVMSFAVSVTETVASLRFSPSVATNRNV